MVAHELLDDLNSLLGIEVDDGVDSPPAGRLVGELASVPGAGDDALLGKGPQIIDEHLLAEAGGVVGGVVVRLGHVLVGVGVLAQAEVLAGVARHLHGAVPSGVG